MEKQQINKAPWHVPIGVGVLLIRENQVFLVKRAYKDWGFGAIAGELKKGETLRQAAVRHVAKEVGAIINAPDLQFVCVVHYETENEKEAPLVFFFSTQNWTGEAFNKEPKRHSEARWFNLDLLPTHLAPGEDLVFNVYKTDGPNPNAYLEQDWKEGYLNSFD
jgi:ADP-ribose pyrophosphatase YjhB (NUDIX family)